MNRTLADEIANSVTHGIGLVLSLVAATALMIRVSPLAPLPFVVGCGVYAAALIAVFFASTMSHCARPDKLKHRFRVLDQAFIYILIVATYTPISVLYFHSRWSWSLLAMMWTIALAGFFSKISLAHRVNSVSIPTYITLGWMPVLNGPRLLDAVPPECLSLTFGGGVCFTAGTLFLINDRKMPMFHALWHISVMAGCGLHFWALWSAA